MKQAGANWTICGCALKKLRFGLESDIPLRKEDKSRGIVPRLTSLNSSGLKKPTRTELERRFASSASIHGWRLHRLVARSWNARSATR